MHVPSVHIVHVVVLLLQIGLRSPLGLGVHDHGVTTLATWDDHA